MDAGLIDEPLSLVRNETGVLIGMVHVMLPYAILTLYANMLGIDAGLVAAARSLGASRCQAFRMVFLPLTAARPDRRRHRWCSSSRSASSSRRRCWAAARC